MKRIIFSAILLAFLTGQAISATAVVTENTATGLKSWKMEDRGFSLELVQLLPEFVQATYDSRDFPPAIYQSMQGYCVFGTVARNETEAPLSYRVADWRYVTRNGKQQRLRTKSEWVATWKKLGADFSYSILPDDITFDAGDWAQGFTTPKITPGTRFDLIYVWSQHGKTFSGRLKNLSCPSGSGLR